MWHFRRRPPSCWMLLRATRYLCRQTSVCVLSFNSLRKQHCKPNFWKSTWGQLRRFLFLYVWCLGLSSISGCWSNPIEWNAYPLRPCDGGSALRTCRVVPGKFFDLRCSLLACSHLRISVHSSISPSSRIWRGLLFTLLRCRYISCCVHLLFKFNLSLLYFATIWLSLVKAEFLLEWFGTLDTTWAIDLLKEMLAKDMRSNLQICVQVATKYSEFMTPSTLIGIFEEFKVYLDFVMSVSAAWSNSQSMEGLYYYLGAIVNFSQDETVHYKYIVACAKVIQVLIKSSVKPATRSAWWRTISRSWSVSLASLRWFSSGVWKFLIPFSVLPSCESEGLPQVRS